jgi:hypothetical protein
MNPERQQFLNLRNIPARLNAQETAWYLGFNTTEIPHLTKARLLKPLGNPNRCTTKFYATVRLRRLREDEPWLNRACATIFKFWQKINDQRKKDENE